MELPEGLRLTVEDRPSAADRDVLGWALDAYNRQFLGETGFSEIALFVRDGGGALAAGLAGSTYAGWLFVADLWVHADLRRRGIGRQLLALAEQTAVARGCHSARLDTFSFQAPSYYPRFGYRLFGALDYPPQHRRYFLWKPLMPAAPAAAARLLPVSVKGVLFEDGRVVLLENERGEWELPGGRLEAGEQPQACLAREFAEEVGVAVAADAILDSWVYEVLPGHDVLIVSYGVRRAGREPLRLGGEHRRLGLFDLSQLAALTIPEGYRRAIRAWAVLQAAGPAAR